MVVVQKYKKYHIPAFAAVKCTVLFVSGFEKRGHTGLVLNFEVLILSENIGNQLSFTASFMFIPAWIHFLCKLIIL